MGMLPLKAKPGRCLTCKLIMRNCVSSMASKRKTSTHRALCLRLKHIYQPCKGARTLELSVLHHFLGANWPAIDTYRYMPNYLTSTRATHFIYIVCVFIYISFPQMLYEVHPRKHLCVQKEKKEKIIKYIKKNSCSCFIIEKKWIFHIPFSSGSLNLYILTSSTLPTLFSANSWSF